MWRAAALVLILAAYGALALGYDRATPAWNNPDEPAHYNYVAQVAETGQLPVLEPGDWNADLLERLKSTDFAGNPAVGTIRYEDWQPPLYYLVAAPVFRMETTEPARVQALRRFDIVLGGLTVLVSYFAARIWLERPWSSPAWSAPVAAVAVAAAMVGVPMFTAMSAAISNDALANFLAAVLTLVLLVALGSAPTVRRALGLGLLLGAALLTKLTLAVFAPVAMLVLAYSAWRCRRPWGLLLSSWVGLVVGTSALLGPWIVRNGLTYGWNDPFASRRHDAVVVGQPRFPGFSAEYAWSWLTTTFHSFWAQFGWMGIPVDARLYMAWGAVTALGVLGLVVVGSRSLRKSAGGLWVTDPRPGLLVAVVLAVFVALIGYNLMFVQAQGRYLFPGLTAICILLVAGWQALVPGRAGGAVALAIAVALIGLNGYTLVRQVAPAFGTQTALLGF